MKVAYSSAHPDPLLTERMRGKKKLSPSPLEGQDGWRIGSARNDPSSTSSLIKGGRIEPLLRLIMFCLSHPEAVRP